MKRIFGLIVRLLMLSALVSCRPVTMEQAAARFRENQNCRNMELVASRLQPGMTRLYVLQLLGTPSEWPGPVDGWNYLSCDRDNRDLFYIIQLTFDDNGYLLDVNAGYEAE